MSTSDVQPSASTEAAAVADATVKDVQAAAPANELPTSTATQDAHPDTAATTAVEEPVDTSTPAAVEEPIDTSTRATGPTWPELSADHPLRKLQERLSGLLEATGHNEVFGVILSATTPIPFTTTLILQKFLRANANDVDKAAHQLKETLQWRKEFQPLKAAQDEVFDASRFGGVGFITVIRSADGTRKEIVTWNIYGAVKDNKVTFGDLDGFLRYRVALMERSIRHLHLSDATTPIPDYNQGSDPYQIVQVHDYLSVRFLRMDPAVRAASQRTIGVFQSHYPELLSRKFFVNVPVVMGWLFAAMKVFVAKETSRKLTMLSYGDQLAAELGPDVPTVYGGNAKPLDLIGETVRLTHAPTTKKTPGQNATDGAPATTGNSEAATATTTAAPAS